MSRWTQANRIGEPEPILFGLRVQPITLGHIRLIDELGISIDSDSLADSILVALVCSQHHERSRKDACKWWFPYVVQWHSRRAGAKVNPDEEVKRFGEWLEFNLTGPSRKVRGFGETRGGLAAPLYYNMMASAMGTLGMSMEEAESKPIKTIRQLLAAFHEAAGEIELWTEREYAFEEACKRADERKRNTVLQQARN